MAPKARLAETPLLPAAPVFAGVPAEVAVAAEVAAGVLEAVVAAAAATLDEYAFKHVCWAAKRLCFRESRMSLITESHSSGGSLSNMADLALDSQSAYIERSGSGMGGAVCTATTLPHSSVADRYSADQYDVSGAGCSASSDEARASRAQNMDTQLVAWDSSSPVVVVLVACWRAARCGPGAAGRGLWIAATAVGRTTRISPYFMMCGLDCAVWQTVSALTGQVERATDCKISQFTSATPPRVVVSDLGLVPRQHGIQQQRGGFARNFMHKSLSRVKMSCQEPADSGDFSTLLFVLEGAKRCICIAEPDSAPNGKLRRTLRKLSFDHRAVDTILWGSFYLTRQQQQQPLCYSTTILFETTSLIIAAISITVQPQPDRFDPLISRFRMSIL